MHESRLVQVFRWSRKSAFQMIIRSFSFRCCFACKGSEWNRIWDPVSENYFSWDRLLLIICIKLNMEMISFHQRIDRNSFILWFCVSLCCDHKWDLTRLEIEIRRGKDSDESICSIGVIVSAIFSLNIPIEITFGNSIYAYIRFWQVWGNLYDEFSISQHICFGQVIS